MTGTIANKPGLFLDPATHRWTRVPRPETELTPFRRMVDAQRAQQAMDRNAVLDAHALGHVEFSRPAQGDARRSYMAVLPDASHRGKYRVQMYDEHGPYGHETFDTKAEALQELGDRGHTEPQPGAMDRFTTTDTWRRGSALVHIIQRLGNIPDVNTPEGVHQFRRPIEAHAGRHGPETTADLMLHHMPALRRGELPDVFLRSRVLFLRRTS